MLPILTNKLKNQLQRTFNPKAEIAKVLQKGSMQNDRLWEKKVLTEKKPFFCAARALRARGVGSLHLFRTEKVLCSPIPLNYFTLYTRGC